MRDVKRSLQLIDTPPSGGSANYQLGGVRAGWGAVDCFGCQTK